jgi:hypothetical protein
MVSDMIILSTLGPNKYRSANIEEITSSNEYDFLQESHKMFCSSKA